ncbi:hypothetical protein H4S06_004916 [Coemansia sp. BCRC 34490]|nr:hypothetical protein H4S06_004916 [Coemansia sp. BCRC 34490]
MLNRDRDLAVLHPLVLLNISDHATRTAAIAKCGGNTAQTQPNMVVGALLGNHVERRYEIPLSFELMVEKEGDTIDINSLHFQRRLEQLKVIFPNHDFIGWYAVSLGLEVSPLIESMHAKLLTLNPSALLLVFDARAASEQPGGLKYSLPLSVYETQPPEPANQAEQHEESGEEGRKGIYIRVPRDIKDTNDALDGIAMVWRLMPLRIAIESGEAERIATEHVANTAKTLADDGVANIADGSGKDVTMGGEEGVTGATPLIATFLSSQRIAIEMLQSDLRVLKTYVGDVINGKAVFDPDVLQLVQRMLSNKPVVKDDAAFDLAMAQEETNYQMALYLSGITKAVASVRSLSYRANTALESARVANTPVVNPNQDSMFDLTMNGMMAIMGGGSGMVRRMGGRARGGFGADNR